MAGSRRSPEVAWLSIEPDPVLTFLHRADPACRRGTAVLLCPPFGWEETCSYRGRRAWAQALAEAGFACARITLPGTGDSGGGPRDPARLEAWTGAVASAAAWLRDEADAARLVALGLGLGGILACLAAEQGAPIDDFILWGVASRGRTHLRELRAYSGMIPRYPEDAQSETLADGELELTGFLLGAETARELEAVELQDPHPRATARRVLLLGRDGLPVDRRLRGQFEQCGAEVTVQDGGDYGLLTNHPQEATAPVQTIAQTMAWLSSAPDYKVRSPLEALDVPRATTAHLAGSIAIRETRLRLSGELEGCFAVLSDCPGAVRSPVCAVWLNGGALHHIGPNRAWVEVARRWAARGVATVRVDLPGLGESDGEDPRPLPDRDLYLARRTQETLVILEQLAVQGVGERFVVGGLCSGAYWALQAALADPRVVGAIMINLFTVFWSKELADERQTERSLGALQGRAWQKLVRGQLTGEHVRSALATISPARLRAGRGHPVQRAQRAQVLHALDQLREQGTEALVLLSQGEGLYDQLRRQGVLDCLDRWPNLSVTQIPTRDHMFRSIWLQRHVHDCLDGALDRTLARASARGRQSAMR